MADSYLTPEEQELRQDAIRLTRRNDTILNVITRLEKALEENERLLGIARRLDDFVGYSGTEYLDIEEYQWWQSIDLAKEGDG